MSEEVTGVWVEGYGEQKGRYRLVVRDGVVTKAEAAERAYESSDVMVDAPGEDLVLPSGIRGIGDRAFLGSGVRSVRLPAGVTWIGEEAFLRCDALKEVVLPEGLTTIGREAFRDCWALETVVLPETLETLFL